MVTRIITALVGLVVFFLIVFAGNVALTSAVCIVTVGMLIEVYKSIKSPVQLTVTGFLSAGLMLASIILGQVTTEAAMLISIFFYLAVKVINHKQISYEDAGTHCFITFFITMFFGMNIRIYTRFGLSVLIIVFLCAWTTDTGAYFFGRAFGKHKLIPEVSPQKTVEGAIGGVFTAGVSGALYLFILNKINCNIELGYVSMIVLSICSSVFSQIGDLAASSIKRDCNVKDFGNLLPGHGGMLDRFDSVIYITPVIYYFFVAISKL